MSLFRLSNGHAIFDVDGTVSIGVDNRTSGAYVRPKNFFTAGLICSGNAFGLTGPSPSAYGLNGPPSIVGGFIIAGNGPANVVAGMGSSSLFNAVPQGFLGFIKDTGTTNVPGFWNSNTLADWDITYSIGHRNTAREDIARLGYEGSFSFLKQVGTPTTPAATTNKIYFKADDGLYAMSSSGVEVSVGGSPTTTQVITAVDGGTDSVTAGANKTLFAILNPAGPLTTYTLNLPVAQDGQVVTITTSQAIATITLVPASGTIVGAVTTLSVGSPARYVWVASLSMWFPA